ncbi:hypothetical protein AGR56_05705 [Clostridium sp. DMHC 10]|uniref:hypothetical protein n=1 Tax=Clostridium sp. DMHC 10 TaxID=747377 RepID=UPI00069DE9FB|nr:hypothetical protein [Clostridium sp. DMHC 10]KOF56323.1 hypothetical protein AGR56_05705 [Clostridium sp. DMHC 10]
MIKNQGLFSKNQFKDIEKNIISNVSRGDITHIEDYDKYIQKLLKIQQKARKQGKYGKYGRKFTKHQSKTYRESRFLIRYKEYTRNKTLCFLIYNWRGIR